MFANILEVESYIYLFGSTYLDVFCKIARNKTIQPKITKMVKKNIFEKKPIIILYFSGS